MAVASTPAATPIAPPSRASRIASLRNCPRMLALAAPRARRRPISERRSRTPVRMMLPPPTARSGKQAARGGGGRVVGAAVEAADQLGVPGPDGPAEKRDGRGAGEEAVGGALGGGAG